MENNNVPLQYTTGNYEGSGRIWWLNGNGKNVLIYPNDLGIQVMVTRPDETIGHTIQVGNVETAKKIGLDFINL